MGWSDILTKLSQGIGNATSSPATSRDVTRAAAGPGENRGIFGILNNIDQGLSARKVAEKEFTEGEEDRSLNNDLKRAQAENLRSLGTYRQGMLGIHERANEIKAITNEVKMAKNEGDLKIAAEKLVLAYQKAQTDMRNAETNARNATTAEERSNWEREYKNSSLLADIAQNAIENDLKNKSLMINQQNANTQSGFLGIAQDKAPSEIAGNEARAGLAGAETEKTIAETDILNDPANATGRILDTLGKGEKSGYIQPSGREPFFKAVGGERLGVTAPSLGVMGTLKNKVNSMIGVTPQGPSNPATPVAPTPAPVTGPKPVTNTTQNSLQNTPPVSSLKEGVNTKFANGQVWTLSGGKPKRVK
jgi:hypothetical protein